MNSRPSKSIYCRTPIRMMLIRFTGNSWWLRYIGSIVKAAPKTISHFANRLTQPHTHTGTVKLDGLTSYMHHVRQFIENTHDALTLCRHNSRCSTQMMACWRVKHLIRLELGKLKNLRARAHLSRPGQAISVSIVCIDSSHCWWASGDESIRIDATRCSFSFWPRQTVFVCLRSPITTAICNVIYCNSNLSNVLSRIDLETFHIFLCFFPFFVYFLSTFIGLGVASSRQMDAKFS